jgi:hypothetical protein
MLRTLLTPNLSRRISVRGPASTAKAPIGTRTALNRETSLWRLALKWTLPSTPSNYHHPPIVYHYGLRWISHRPAEGQRDRLHFHFWTTIRLRVRTLSDYMKDAGVLSQSRIVQQAFSSGLYWHQSNTTRAVQEPTKTSFTLSFFTIRSTFFLRLFI